MIKNENGAAEIEGNRTPCMNLWKLLRELLNGGDRSMFAHLSVDQKNCSFN